MTRNDASTRESRLSRFTWWQRSSRSGQICICLNRQVRQERKGEFELSLGSGNFKSPILDPDRRPSIFPKGFIGHALGALCVLSGSIVLGLGGYEVAPGAQSLASTASSLPFRREVFERLLNEFIDPGALFLRLVEVFHPAFNPGSPEELSR